MNSRFTLSLTKAELDSIQKQLLEEMDEMLDKVRFAKQRKEMDRRRKPYKVTLTVM